MWRRHSNTIAQCCQSGGRQTPRWNVLPSAHPCRLWPVGDGLTWHIVRGAGLGRAHRWLGSGGRDECWEEQGPCACQVCPSAPSSDPPWESPRTGSLGDRAGEEDGVRRRKQKCMCCRSIPREKPDEKDRGRSLPSWANISIRNSEFWGLFHVMFACKTQVSAVPGWMGQLGLLMKIPICQRFLLIAGFLFYLFMNLPLPPMTDASAYLCALPWLRGTFMEITSALTHFPGHLNMPSLIHSRAAPREPGPSPPAGVGPVGTHRCMPCMHTL